MQGDGNKEVRIAVERRRPRRRWTGRGVAVASLLVIGGLVAAGWFGWRPLYRRAKESKGRAALQRGQSLLAEGRLDAAVPELRMAFHLAPEQPEVLRAVAELNARMGSPEALHFYIRLIELGSASVEDRIAAAGLALQTGTRDQAGALIEGLTREVAGDRRVWRLALEHSRQFASSGATVALARHVVRLYPDDVEAEYDLGRFLMASGGRQQRMEGTRLLWSVAVGRSGYREPAARLLAEQGLLGRGEATTLARVLESGGTLESRLVAAQLRVREEPSSRDEWIGKVGGWVGPEAPVPELLGVVRWLEMQGGASRALGLLSADRCRTNLALLGARVDCLLAAEEFVALRAMAEDRGSGLDAAMGAAALGAVLGREGKVVEAEGAFEEAMAVGGRQDLVLPFVVREAFGCGAEKVAVRALLRWMERPGAAGLAGRRLVEWIGRIRDLEVPRDALRRLHGLLPGEDWVAAELAWVELLTEGQVGWALHEFERMQRRWPEDVGIRVGVAFGLWRNGDGAGAQHVLVRGGLEVESLDVRQRMAAAVVLGAAGQREAARRMVRGLDRGRVPVQMEVLLEAYW